MTVNLTVDANLYREPPMSLTDAACRAAKPAEKPRKLSDSGGLYLFVSPSGTKTWRLDYAFQGKRKTASLGRYPGVKLVEAREERDRMKAEVAAGRDPMQRYNITFEKVARDWFAANRSKWKSSYSERFWRRIEQDILTSLGDRVVSEVQPQEILKLLREIEERDAIYTAKRICQMVSTIYRFAISEGHASSNPAENLMSALKPLPKREHRAALAESDLPEFFRRLRAYDGDETTKLGLAIVMHTFVRTNEIRYATWSEIDGDVWRIEGDRMKMGKTHLIPLSRQVQELLAQLRELTGHTPWLLPGRDSNRKPVSENTLLYALRNMGYHRTATVHGFRGTASTILNESGKWNSDWIERQLAHVPKDQVRSAYNAAQWMDQRREMMQWYSDLLERNAKEDKLSFNSLLM